MSKVEVKEINFLVICPMIMGKIPQAWWDRWLMAFIL
jgi:hypothetical protein